MATLAAARVARTSIAVDLRAGNVEGGAAPGKIALRRGALDDMPMA